VNATIPGTYCLEVFDSRGCFETACKTISIFQETLLTDTIITAGTSIGGGGVDITLDSVSAPYLYFWSNGRISQDLVNVPFGNYQVTIVDKNDCPTVRLFNVPLRTSTNDSQISKCEIFPSLVKAGNLINLNCADVNPSRAQIFNLQGQESALINIEENQIKLPADLPMGTYLLKIYSLDGLIKVEKIVIY
jgi:hypothetical protein